MNLKLLQRLLGAASHPQALRTQPAADRLGALEASGTHGVSFQRSGRNWVSAMLELYHGGPVFSDFFGGGPGNQTFADSWTHDRNLDFTARRVLYLYRHPVDTLFSMHLYFASEALPSWRKPVVWPDDDPDVSHVEARVLGWARRWTANVDKWAFDPPSGCQERLVLTYEDLAADPVDTLERVVGFVWPDVPVQSLRCEACVGAISKQFLSRLRSAHHPQTMNPYTAEQKEAFVSELGDRIMGAIHVSRVRELVERR